MTDAEDRTVFIELDGVLRQIPATYHRSGRYVGRLITERVFLASDPDAGEGPAPVRMALHRPKDDTDPRLVVVDDTENGWVMSFQTQVGYRITGFYPTKERS
ncbi:hypothetical protein [Streptomyces sp. gCLA4]|uniref:hypothetical protein n=1 Tax=Streptomyces sp. gCLA4 TaxID=1873416 RepID=UPI0015FF411A|nr:hypothetical protein [Streptomyces sp. gCLA4]